MARWTELTTADRNVFNDLRFDLATQVQRAKVDNGMAKVNQLRKEGLMPADSKDITAYLTSTTIANQWPDINRFNKYMVKAPKSWKKKFLYVSGSGGSASRLAEAAEFAVQMIAFRTLDYPYYFDNKPTGRLQRSITMLVDGLVTTSPSREIKDKGGNALFEITNIAPYASDAEVRSFYFRGGGIIYYTAQRVQRRFPELGVNFTYTNNLGISTGHKYSIPILQIGPKDMVDNRWSKPGDRQRKAAKHNKRLRARMKRIRGVLNGT